MINPPELFFKRSWNF